MNRWRSWLNARAPGADRARLERDMNDEMQLHIEMEAAHLQSLGVAAGEARRRAMVAFGGAERFKEEARDVIAVRWANDFIADVRFAGHSLRRTPAFTAVAVLALGVAIGIATTVFAAVDSTVFRKLPVDEPGELAALFVVAGDATLINTSYRTFEQLRTEIRSFSDVAAFTEGAVTIAGAGQPAVAWAMHTSDNYFRLLGLSPKIGRFYGAGDFEKPVAVLSHDFWKSALGGRRDIVGQPLQVNGARFTVIGVAPAGFNGTRLFTYSPAVWTPVGNHPRTIPGIPDLLTERGPTRFSVIGRLRKDVTLAQAQAELDATVRQVSTEEQSFKGLQFEVISNARSINPWLASTQSIRTIGALLLGAVCLVLLIACANVASLLLARMSRRETEITVRLAIGASSGRLLRQFLTESIVLSSAGLAAAIPIFLMLVPAVAKMTPALDFAPTSMPFLDARAFVFALSAALVSSVVFGIAPFTQALSISRRHNGRSRRWSRGGGVGLRQAVVVTQVALCVFVLCAAGLVARALQAARNIDIGFDTASAATFTLNPSLLPGYDQQRTEMFFRQVLAQLEIVPGVRSITRTSSVPLDGDGTGVNVGGVTADAFIVDENYFATMDIPLSQGRVFSTADTAGSQPIVVNEVLAKKLSVSGNLLGRRIQLGRSGPTAEVVGIAHATASRQLGDAPRPLVWLWVHRNPRPRATIVMRTGAPPESLFPVVRQTVRALDPHMPVIGLRTLDDRVALAYSAVRTGTIAGTVFGFLAAILAATGIFGILAYTVSRRTREIGLRIALGAQRTHILRLVAGSELRLAVPGIAIGWAMALALPADMSRFLYGVSPHDPVVLASAAVVFVGLAVVASIVPARKALHLDPARALRAE